MMPIAVHWPRKSRETWASIPFSSAALPVRLRIRTTGANAEGSRRLYLYLVNHDGQLLWKDELPFTLVQGFTPLLEASVQTDFSQHMMQQVKALRFDELGYLPKRIS